MSTKNSCTACDEQISIPSRNTCDMIVHSVNTNADVVSVCRLGDIQCLGYANTASCTHQIHYTAIYATLTLIKITNNTINHSFFRITYILFHT